MICAKVSFSKSISKSMLTETMIIKPQSLRVALALANDVLFAEEDLKNAIIKLNEKNNYPVKFDIVWCNEQSSTDEQSDWSRYFYYETPIPLIERINEVHKPDLIICVFWKLFGLKQGFPSDTPEQARGNSEKAAQKWAEKDFTKTKVLFCKQDPKLNEEDKNKRLFISYFRSQVNEDVSASCNKNQIAKEIEKNLSEFVTSNFNKQTEDIEQEQKYRPSPLLELNLPDDWLYLNRWLNENSALIGQKLDDKAAANFFNGTRPSFAEALSSSIPRRAIVKDLLKIITKATTDRRFAVTLLLGPGGEGKSTILRQVAFDLIRQRKPEIQVVFRQDTSNLSKLIENLRYKKGSFVIVSDDAQTIAKGISELAKRDDKPNNIQFFLASRTTHWEWEKRANSDLETYLGDNFVKRRIGILIEEDAEKIIKYWEKANALEKLADFPSENRVNRFLSVATAKASQQNSFFSAILWVRKHQTLDARVKDILDGLKEKSSLNGKTLDYYYNYIIALHGDGIPILTEMVLQEALGCDETKLKEEVLDPLIGETAILQEGKLILARHDVFAERAKEILKSRVDFNKIIGKLAVAAEKLYRDDKLGYNENPKWIDLKNEYFNKQKKPEVSLSIVKAIAEEYVSDPIMVGRWANVLREWGEDLRRWGKDLKRKSKFSEAESKFNEASVKLQEANTVFLRYYDKTIPDRGYFTDWGVVQGELGNSYLSSWLTAISLTDDLKEKQRQTKPIVMRFASLATAFSKSFIKSIADEKQSIIFKRATEGVFKLSFGEGKKKIDERAKKVIDFPNFNDYKRFDFIKTEDYLNSALHKVQSNDVSKISLDEAFQAILNGINLAWELCEVDREYLPESLPNAPNLNFNKLKKMFGIKIPVQPEKHSDIEGIEQHLPDQSLISEIEIVKLTLPETIESPKYIFRRSEETVWEIVFNDAEPFSIKVTDGIRYIYKLLQKRNTSSNPNVIISAKSLFDEDGKDTNKTQAQLRNNLDSHIKTALNNISNENNECYEFFEKRVKVKLISNHAYLSYEPTNPEPKWQLN